MVSRVRAPHGFHQDREEALAVRRQISPWIPYDPHPASERPCAIHEASDGYPGSTELDDRGNDGHTLAGRSQGDQRLRRLTLEEHARLDSRSGARCFEQLAGLEFGPEDQQRLGLKVLDGQA